MLITDWFILLIRMDLYVRKFGTNRADYTQVVSIVFVYPLLFRCHIAARKNNQIPWFDYLFSLWYKKKNKKKKKKKTQKKKPTFILGRWIANSGHCSRLEPKYHKAQVQSLYFCAGTLLSTSIDDTVALVTGLNAQTTPG